MECGRMPDFLERKLEAGAEKKGFSGKRKDRYVYGFMNKHGLMSGNKITSKGRAMERKHEEKMSRKG